LSSNAFPTVHRSSRMSCGFATTPFGSAMTTVMALKGNRSSCWNDAFDPSLDEPSHSAVEPYEPWKQRIAVISPGASMLAAAWSMITPHWSPTTFQ
jgi:hypothetical protein